MTTHTRLRLGAVALMVLAMLLLGGSHLCGVAQDPGSRPLSSGVLACGEFWLNRYQTLIAALIAGSIAYWAGRLLFRQVETQRFDFLARKLTDLHSIRAAAEDLNRICGNTLGPDVRIRMRGQPVQGGLLNLFYETKFEDFWNGVTRAREASARLEANARRPIGPSQTAREARLLVACADDYLRYCTSDLFHPSLNNFMGGLSLLGQQQLPAPDVRERNPKTRESFIQFCEAYSSFCRASEVELDQLEREQARAHSVAR